ncbi:MAG: hypothetical protein IJT70_00940 [Clostridia bacterium]|nr:hypothetical protein [Clostridia bacterium]
MKRIISFVLIVILAFSAVALSSCGKSEEGVPSGMKLASADTATYSFYVPESWKCDVASGATTAYYSNSDTSNVSVMTFSLPYTDSDVDDWWKSFSSDFNVVYKDFKVISEEPATLDGVVGMKYVFSGKLTHDNGGEPVEEPLKFMQVVAIRSKAMSSPEAYVITYTSSDDVYDSHLDDVGRMIENFKFK